jgi:hypothetical protein
LSKWSSTSTAPCELGFLSSRQCFHFINDCRVADGIGVAVEVKGAPLMRMFHANRRPLSPEDEAALARLNAVASRIRAATTHQMSDGMQAPEPVDAEEPAEAPDPAKAEEPLELEPPAMEDPLQTPESSADERESGE